MTSPEQRVELVKSESQRIQRYLEGLSNEDWTQTSACDAWEIRDVVAHLTASVDLYESAISRGITGDSNPPEGLSAAGVSSLMTRLEENTQKVINLRQEILCMSRKFRNKSHRGNKCLIIKDCNTSSHTSSIH